MKYKTFISVVMPCYNSETYISAAIQSILKQSFESFELIIINDGSLDNTENEIKKYKDSRIKYFRNDKNKGNYAARNIGLNIVKGKYTCVMDSDDIAFPDRLQKQFDYLESHPSVGCVGGLSQAIDEDNNIIGIINRPLIYPKIKTWLFKNNYVTHPTIMIRSSLIKKHRLFYDEKLKYSSDYDFIVKASSLFPIRNLNEVILKYRLHPNQISSAKHGEQIKYADTVRKKQLKLFGMSFTEKEIDLHLRLMKGEYIGYFELNKCEKWLNKLYNINCEKKIYNSKYLYDLFDEILTLAVYNNSVRNKDNSSKKKT